MYIHKSNYQMVLWNRPKVSWIMASTMISLKALFNIIKILLWLFLFMICLFFVKSIFDQYHSNATSIKRSFKKFDRLKLPTVVYCTDPPIKKTVMDKYNLTTDFLMNYIFTKQEEPIDKLLEESGYSMDADFNLSIYTYPIW